MSGREKALSGLLERPRPTVFAALAVMLFSSAGLWISGLLVSRMALTGAMQAFAVDLMYYLPFVALPIALYMLRRPGLSASMRLNPVSVSGVLAAVSAAILSVYLASVVNSAWALLLNAVGLHEPQAGIEVASSRALSLAILHTAAIPAVCEELMCRGLVFSAFESRGTRPALWASSALFMLMHGNVYGFPAYLMVGAIAAFLVFALDSLYAGMIYHTVYNTVILLMLYLLPQADGTAAAPQGSLYISVAVDAAFMILMLVLLLRGLNLRRKARSIEAVPRMRAPLRRGEWALLIALTAVFVVTGILVLLGV